MMTKGYFLLVCNTLRRSPSNHKAAVSILRKVPFYYSKLDLARSWVQTNEYKSYYLKVCICCIGGSIITDSG